MSERQKLTPAQVELYMAMQRGVVVHYISGIDAHYFRTDGKTMNSATAHALQKKGWAVKSGEDWRGHVLQINPATQSKEGPI